MNGITSSTNNLGLGLRRRKTRTITSREAGEIGGAQSSGSNIARTLSTVAAGNAAEDVNAQLNQMDASNSLNISQQINSVGIGSVVPVNNSGSNSLAAHLPHSIVVNILSFYPNMITAPINKAISKDLLHI